MISLIAAALQEAAAASERGDGDNYAHHGRAGGVAAAAGVFGIKALSLCDDISNAYETGDAAFMAAILVEATERLDNPDAGAAITEREAISWPEYGAALHQAVEAKSASDSRRYALMTGFTAGLMFNDPGPRDREHGSILDAVTAAYSANSDQALTYAQSRIASGVRMTDPTPFMPDDQYNRYYEERMRMMRWVQNFGLRQARTTDQKVAMPGSMSINHAARRQAGRKDGLDNAAAYIGAANAKMNQGDYDGAIADCDRAIALDPDDPGGCNIRGMSKWRKGDNEWRKGDNDGAIADFDRAIELDPKHGMAYHIRGMIKGEQDNYQEAIADFDRAIEQGINDAGVYN